LRNKTAGYGTSLSRAWWYMPVIPALGRQRQEDPEFKASLGYIARPYLKTSKITNKQKKPPLYVKLCTF
jgi:hypothetical protein